MAKKQKDSKLPETVMTTDMLVPKENIEVKKEYIKTDTQFVEFLIDANVHWIGKQFQVGDKCELNIEDVEKLKKTNHVKIIERKDK